MQELTWTVLLGRIRWQRHQHLARRSLDSQRHLPSPNCAQLLANPNRQRKDSHPRRILRLTPNPLLANSQHHIQRSQLTPQQRGVQTYRQGTASRRDQYPHLRQQTEQDVYPQPLPRLDYRRRLRRERPILERHHGRNRRLPSRPLQESARPNLQRTQQRRRKRLRACE